MLAVIQTFQDERTKGQWGNKYYSSFNKTILEEIMLSVAQIPSTNEQEAPLYKKIQNYIFKFTDLLGQGNFSKVYKAHHEITNKVVAIKIVELNSLKSKKLEELLFSEIDVLKNLNHPNILECYEVFSSNRNCYIITEICNEGDLESKLRQRKAFTEQQADPIIRDVLEGLLYLADKSVIHRDLKVANIFMHNNRAKIADFGFAKFTNTKFKDINIGSPIYMSPEGFISHIYGPKTDIWAFGVLIYQMLHGETPFAFCKTENELKYNLSIPINPNKFKMDLSTEIKEVILRCMEIDEEKRITAYQLGNLPYFRKLSPKSPYRNSPDMSMDFRTQASSFNVNSESTGMIMLSDNNLNLNLIKKRSDESPKPSNYLNVNPGMIYAQGQRSPSTDKGGRYNSNQKPQNVLVSQDYLPNPKTNRFSRQYSADKIVRVQQNNLKTKQVLISTMVNFKQTVNIMHYCRLIYKYLMTVKKLQYNSEAEVATFSCWLLLILDEINCRIQNNGIIYEGENSWLREKKLREVAQEYQKKYRNQLYEYSNREPLVQLNLIDMHRFAYGCYQKIDGFIARDNNRNLLFLGHAIVMICDATTVLKRCYDERRYATMLTYKDIESFLNSNLEQMDLHSYLSIRKKILHQ